MAVLSRLCRILLIFSFAAGAYAADTGKIELSWLPPEERTSGEELAMNDLAGYRIYYGPTPEATAGLIEIRDPNQTAILVKGLTPEQNYYFAITTYDRQGRESARSNIIEAQAE